jgi:hypothetical protein
MTKSQRTGEPKPRNAADATLRNIRASNLRDASVRKMIKALEARIVELETQVSNYISVIDQRS